MNLIEFLQEHRIPYKVAGQSSHVTHGWVGVICPYCGQGTGKYGYGIHIRSLASQCWKCGPHNTITTLAQIAQIRFRDVQNALTCDLTFEQSERGRIDSGRSKTILPSSLCALTDAHRNYLRERGFTPEDIEEVWGVQAIAHIGPPYLRWRLFIPIVQKGEIVNWTTRSINPKNKARYLNARPENVKVLRRELLYGEDYVKHTVVIVEGPTDAWRIGPGAVATMGLAFSNRQVVKLSRFPIRVICFDQEEGAQQQARKLQSLLGSFPGETYRVVLESGKDPGNADMEEVLQLRRRFGL